jgi:uncharacterized protein YwgA
MSSYSLHKKVAAIIQDAGGQLVGRTRLQKITYLSQLAGFSSDFEFEYRHYGPYSEELSDAARIATGLKIIKEEERPTEWGGWYSIFSTEPNVKHTERTDFISLAAKIDAIELELAATAAFLYDREGIGKKGQGDPWRETAKRKPEKAAKLEQAKNAYRTLSAVRTPKSLPAIV